MTIDEELMSVAELVHEIQFAFNLLRSEDILLLSSLIKLILVSAESALRAGMVISGDEICFLAGTAVLKESFSVGGDLDIFELTGHLVGDTKSSELINVQALSLSLSVCEINSS